MKTIRLFARIIVGSVFIFSGFVKGIDLLGSAYKFHDYFQAFHIDFLQSLSFPLAFLFPVTEFLIGMSLFFLLKPRIGTWGLLLFMSFFTPLTLILALFNPVKDCGCFGDALVVTNWQTFYKNLILLTLTIFLFIERKKLTSRYTGIIQWGLLLFYFLVFTGLSVYSYNHLPLFDFRPFKTGTNIPENMTTSEEALQDEYKTTLIYEKNGIRKEFSLNDFPWQDSTWKFIDQKSVLVKKGHVPPIHDFSIIESDGTDITYRVLKNPGYTFLLISPDLEKADIQGLQKAYELSVFAADHNIDFYLLTSSGKDQIKNLYDSEGITFPYCSTDETTLETIIRSNPGLLLIREGTILGKWHYHDIPPADYFSGDMLAGQINHLNKKRDALLTFVLIFGLFLFAGIIHMIIPAAGKTSGYESK